MSGEGWLASSRRLAKICVNTAQQQHMLSDSMVSTQPLSSTRVAVLALR